MKIIKIFAPVGIVALMLTLFSFYNPSEKNGYVNLQIVFESFEGKIELEKRLQQSDWSTQLYLDSLNLKLDKLHDLIQSSKADVKLKNEIEEKQNQIAHIEQQRLRIGQQKSGEFTQQIWNQINQYVKDFGEAKGYDYIFGADGAGVLMYGRMEKNLTGEIINYINKRYHGE